LNEDVSNEKIKSIINKSTKEKIYLVERKMDKDNLFHKIIKKGKNSYNCKNFYFNNDLKFWTYNSEILRIVDYFNFKHVSSNNNNNNKTLLTTPSNKSKILRNEAKKFDLYDDLEIHFVDACISLSKYVTSKKHSLFQDSLREKIVEKFTKGLWQNKFGLIREDLEKGKNNVLSELLSTRILSKIKPKLQIMLESARRNLLFKYNNDTNQNK
jgi:hypothetical protein